MSAQTSTAAEQHVIHESWTFKDGAPGDVACLAQTNDGFLWLGGQNGLFRFDGTRFEPFNSPFGDLLLSNNLFSLFAPPSGGLWIGYTLGGFSFLNNGRVTNYGGEIATSTGSVYGFDQDRDGIVWAAASSGLWRFDHSGWQHIGSDWNAPTGYVPQVGFDSEGILWALAGGHDGPMDLIYLLPGTRHFKTGKKNLSAQGFTLDADRTVITHAETPPMSDSGEGSDKEPAAYPVLPAKETVQFVDRNDSMWMSRAGKPAVMRLPKERLHDLNNEVSAGSSETYDVNFFEMAKLVDREGNIWFGDPKGIHRFFYSPLNEQKFPKEESGNADFAMAADDHGAVWISFGGGDNLNADLYYVSRGKAERRLPQVTSDFTYRAPDKTFWFSGEGCLWHLVGHNFVRVNLPPEMADKFGFLQAITQDQHGGIWVSFGRHGLYRWANGYWTPYGGRDDLPKTGVFIEFTDSLGRVWFGYTKSQLAVLDGDKVRVFGPSNGLEVGNILAIYGQGSEIWIGGEFGLVQFDRGRFHNIAAVNDEWLRGVSGIVETSDGDLWLNAISGIFHIPKAEISRALKDSTYRVRGEHFGRREGLPGIAQQVRPLPTAIEGTDGRLWFTLRNGVVWLDPAAYSQKATVRPPITIQSVSADDKSYAPAPPLSFAANTSSVQISYSAVSLTDPEAIRFRYKLRERDKDWHEVAASSPVTYRNLPPGSYHFNVEASDTNGVWSGAPATAEFTILPAFYQTRWFFLLCMAATGFLVWLAYRWRVHVLTGRLDMQFHERLAERTRIAQELHDTLLQGVLSASMQLHVANDQLTKESPAKPLVERVLELITQVVDEGRSALRGLRLSKGTQDLDLAFARVPQEPAVKGTAEFRVSTEGLPRPLRPPIQDEVYRIGREAVVNAFRHSGATQIEVAVEYGAHELRVLVRDNGCGIDSEVLRSGREGHFGLLGMRERAEKIGAKLKVLSAVSGGTEVDLRVPGRFAFESHSAGTIHKLLSKFYPQKTDQHAKGYPNKVGKS